MRIVTDLMDKIFSEETPDAFKNSVSEKIEEAKTNGQAELKTGDAHYSFACVDDRVLIEDKFNENEVTLAYSTADGDTKLEGVPAATAPDVQVPGNQDGKKGILPDDSTVNDVNVTIEKTAGIVDKDTAGVGKNFSLCIHGFETEEEAQQFFSDLCDDSENITFSDDELEQVAFSATEMVQLGERLNGTMDLELAFSLKDSAESLHAYSVLAANSGVECDDLIEASQAYSEMADEAITEIYSEMPVNEFFSELDQEETTEYFSNLDEVESQVLLSALQSDENYTFSDVQEAVDQLYSDLYIEDQLSQSVNEVFSEMNEEELDAFFSQFSESESNTIFSVLEENEDATFSDLNDALEPLNESLDVMFSEMSEDEVDEFCNMYSDEEVDTLFSMVSDEEINYTFSDFLDYVIDNRSFSDEDLETLSSNMNEIMRAFSDMESMEDGDQKTELSKQVKVLADKTLDDCEKAEAAGHNVDDVKDKCAEVSEKAAEVADKAEPTEKPTEAPTEAPTAAPTAAPTEAPTEAPKANGEQRVQSNPYMNDGTRIFSQSQQGGKQFNSSINPCLTSVIH